MALDDNHLLRVATCELRVKLDNNNNNNSDSDSNSNNNALCLVGMQESRKIASHRFELDSELERRRRCASWPAH